MASETNAPGMPAVAPGAAANYCEKQLSDEQFLGTFSTDEDAFGKLPIWKQQQLKKQRGLF